ncbi:MAG: RluA family pseudouridine synthase [Clostridia bacterium]|nr:RluA family pseudouridine synthase [Clostridia bacterium]
MKRIDLIGIDGQRVDKFISEQVAELTRSHVQNLISDRMVTVDGKTAKANTKLKNGQEVVVMVPPPRELKVEAEDICLDIIYEDDFMLVVNKPQGMVVHPAVGNYNGTLVNALLNHCKDSLSEINGVIRPGIVHRIDKDTSGLLLVAKNDEAHLSLSEQIKAHTLTREYIALVHGNIRQDQGTIDAPIGRHASDRKKMCVTDKNSKNAVTHYTVLERYNGYCFVKCRLETGRTHQIRVHMASIGHPVIGDPVYGPKKSRFSEKAQLLHAVSVGFVHPKTKEYMEFKTDIPQRFTKYLRKED